MRPSAPVTPTLLLLLCTILVVAVSPARADTTRRALLLVSIDGLRPDYVQQADLHGLALPNLRQLARDGASASGVRGVLPSATYPSHTTLLTGASPARHGIFFNKPFGVAVKDLDVWYCYTEDIRVPTLWDAATQGGLAVGSVSWPVSVGATSIRYNIPEYNLTRTDEDVRITRGAATPGLMAELEPAAGPYLTDVNQAIARDEARTRYAVAMIRQKKPDLLTLHLAASDHLQHRTGPFTPPVREALEKIDRMISDVSAAMRAAHPHAVVCVVSDHGFAAVDRVLWLDSAFVRAGIITLKTRGKTVADSDVSDWIAQTWPAGGSAAIVLRNPTDVAARAKVKAVLDELATDPANGIAGILEEPAIAALGGAPTAQFWVDLRPGFIVNQALQPTIVGRVSARGTHGYTPTHDEMASTFIIAGDGIANGRDLGTIDMRAIAPTLAQVLGVTLPSAERPPLDVFEH
ncbi:MAG TPA: ectonucleotide pyrophosphatase/phosphodiesterase [Opitutaceae bacterium]